MRYLLLIFSILFSLNSTSQVIYRTQIMNSNIKTLKVVVSGEKMGLPIIELNGQNTLSLQFDEMSHEAHSYSYKVLHCNADWTISNLNSSEYLSGFTTANITETKLSVNTTFLYTHYNFHLPNEDIGFKISGNYVVIVYEDNEVDKPIAQACFSIFETKVNVNATVRGNTDTELNGRLQQIDFDLNLNGYSVRDAATEIKVLIQQNNRIDNQIFDIKPTFLSGSKLSYINNRNLIFEGGSEYHRFDISSVYAAGTGVSGIRFQQPSYNAYLFDDKIQASKSYTQDMDVNGQFVVNVQNSQDDDVEADYMYVHFNLPTNQPFFDGHLYLGGDFNYNQLNETSRLKYEINKGSYFGTILLKQGGYNYQYWFVPKGERKASTTRVDGSYWQTSNQYSIYVYHRAWGERYDKLVGIKVIE